jgi:hypothetical protein
MTALPPAASESARIAATAGTGDRDLIAEHLWTVADDIGNAKITWRNHLNAAEREAADVLLTAFLRVGGQVRRGEISSQEGRGNEPGLLL